VLRERLETILPDGMHISRRCLRQSVRGQGFVRSLFGIRQAPQTIVCDVTEHIHQWRAQNKKILFEGAQAHRLISTRAYPFVTSSIPFLLGMLGCGCGAERNR
jgi:adenylosuccinate synthase